MATSGVPSLETAEAAWDAAEAQDRFWQEHYAEYLEKFPDHFVAVVDGEVAATSPDLQQVIHVLEGKRIEPRHAWIRFITADPRRILL